MKIRMFENYEIPYQEIKDSEYKRFIDCTIIIPDNDINTTRKFLENKKKWERWNFWTRPYGQEYVEVIYVKTPSCPVSYLHDLEIVLTDDYWYLVRQRVGYREKFWKCDQTEGLIEFLETEF
jgi:hypothetical protein